MDSEKRNVIKHLTVVHNTNNLWLVMNTFLGVVEFSYLDRNLLPRVVGAHRGARHRQVPGIDHPQVSLVREKS